MRTNIITAAASATTTVVTSKAYQYDYGLRLEVTGLTLPNVTEWQFSNTASGEAAKTTLGDATGCDVPNELLISGQHIYAWLFVHSGTDDGYTAYTFDIPVQQRTRPIEEEPTPEQAGLISQAVAALNAAVEQTGLDVIATGEDAAAAAESARQAGLSEESAYASAQAAAGSVSEISDYATAAYNSKVAAQTAQGKAEDAQTAAETAQGKAEDAQSAAEDARDLALGAKADAIDAKDTAVSKAGEASQSATDASGYATTASNKATEASTNALKAEGYAVGKQNGSDVSSGTYYHNNAKYYSDAASGSATTATTKAGEASTSAQTSEAYAIGKRNGTAVGSSDPAYHNNSKYYADQAASVASSIPADYTTLSNDVTGLKADLYQSGIVEKKWVDICTITHGSGTYYTNVAIGTTVSTTINASTSWGCQLVQVSEGDKFKVTGVGGTNPLLWAFTDTEYKLLSKAVQSSDPQTVEITAPEDGYLFVNTKTAQQTVYSLDQWVVDYKVPELEDKVDALYTTYDKNIIDQFQMYHMYNTSGGVGTEVDMTGSTATQYGSLVDSCKKGQKYIITGTGGAKPRLWCFIDANNIITSVSDNNASATNLVITAPADGKLIYQTSTAYPYSIYKKDVYCPASDVQIEEVDKTLFPYTGFDMFRTIAGLGDSYTEGDLVTSGNTWTTITGINYLDSIAKRNGITANNYGSGGANTNTYLERQAFANCLSATPSDLYMICFGINDASVEMTVGTTADIKEDYTENPNTFCGNYGRILDQLIAHAPSAKIILVMPWPTDADYSAYNEAVEAIAGHYSIPCIDPSDDPFFTSHFWMGYKSGGHPTCMLYAGMGRAVERLFVKCVTDNPRYFRFAVIG